MLTRRVYGSLYGSLRQAAQRRYATKPGEAQVEFSTAEERALYDKLSAQLAPTRLQVHDISGGCGSMYAIDIASAAFNGKSMINQHRLVNETLKAEIKAMHGLQLKTAPAEAKD